MKIETPYTEVSIHGDYQSLLSIKFALDLYNECPGAVLKKETGGSSDWEIIVSQTGDHLEYSDKTIQFARETLYAWDLLYLCGQAIERQQAELGLHTIHGGAVSSGDDAILFAGPSLSGKSTLTAYGVLKKGFEFVGGEKIVLRNTNIVSGTSRLSIDKSPAKRFLSTNHEIDVLFSDVEERELEAIIFPKVTDKGFYSWELSHTHGRLKLMETLDEKLRGDFLLSKQRKPALSLDTEKTRSSREEFLRSISGQVPFYHMEGSPEEIYEKGIEKIL